MSRIAGWMDSSSPIGCRPNSSRTAGAQSKLATTEKSSPSAVHISRPAALSLGLNGACASPWSTMACRYHDRDPRFKPVASSKPFMAMAPSLEAGFTSTLLGGCKSAATTEAVTSTLNTENKVFIIEGPRVSLLE